MANMENEMQVTNTASAAASTTATPPNSPVDANSSDAAIAFSAAEQKSTAADTDSAPVLPATKVSLSAAAQAYLSEPNPPSAVEVARESKKKKPKTLVEQMLEWSQKYEDQQAQSEKKKELTSAGNAAPLNSGASSAVGSANAASIPARVSESLKGGSEE
jgi:hypothetical protein